MIAPSWLWIPLTIFAAAAQTVRNTAQRRLTGELGTLGATLVRFLYGMPLLTLWLLGLLALPMFHAPTLTRSFAGWVLVAGVSQMLATACLLRAMTARSFAIGLVYSKSEVIQVALFSVVFLGEQLSAVTAVAIVVATSYLDEAERCRREGVQLTTFMIATDPALVDFVETLTRVAHGRAYYASPNDLASFVFRDYLRNRKKVLR